ncbi:tetratricopeptide repeat protein [Streptomyces silvensis]|uniref:tetratricopeptide repeat protein n=1 Tax=Streptomyces silvensis TaxID=1765722 RepID=UPI000A56A2E1|nr:tetratricopeptide repeat protein [Streptomyces silvensis]
MTEGAASGVADGEPGWEAALPPERGEAASAPEGVHPDAWHCALLLRRLFAALDTTMEAYGRRKSLHKSTVSRYLSGAQAAPVEFVEHLLAAHAEAAHSAPDPRLRAEVLRRQELAMRATNRQRWETEHLKGKWQAEHHRREQAERQAVTARRERDAALERLAALRFEHDTLEEKASRLALENGDLLRRAEALERDRAAAERRAEDGEQRRRHLAERLEAAEVARERAVADQEAAVAAVRREAAVLLRQARRESAVSRSRYGAGPPPDGVRRYHVLFAGPDAPWGAWLTGRLRAYGADASAELLTPVPGESVAELLAARLRTGDPVVVSGCLGAAGRYTAAEWAEGFRLTGEHHPGRLTVVTPYGSGESGGPRGPGDVRAAAGTPHGVTAVDLSGAGVVAADRRLRLATGTTTVPAAPGPVEALPTDLPEVWGGVGHRDDRFTGRDELLWTIHQELTDDPPPPPGVPTTGTAAAGAETGNAGRADGSPGTPATPDSSNLPETSGGPDVPPAVVRVLVGLPGVGKTAAAVEYVHRFKGLYDVVWWVDARSQDSVRSELARLGEELGGARTEPGAELAALYTAVRSPRAPADRRRILLVLDGAEEPAVLAPLLPGPAVRVLITSQNRAWERYAAELIDVPCFVWAESLTCVTRFDPGRGLRGDRELARRVGDHPGALVRAMRRGHAGDEVRLPSLTDALGRLHARVPQARLLLRLSDRFAEGEVPLRWLRPLPTPDDGTWDAAAHALVEASLARIEADTLRVHPLVRRAALRGAHDGHRAEAAALAVQALTTADPRLPEAPAQWPRYGELLRHLHPSGVLESDAPDARRLVRNCLVFCRWSGAHHQGLELTSRARAGTTAALEPELLEVRARLLRETGRLPEAARLLDRGTDGAPGADGGLVTGARAATLLCRGRYAEADEQARTAYEEWLSTSGPDAPVTLRARALLAECARACGRWEEALDIGTEVLARCDTLTPWSPQTLFARSRHALDLRLLGRYGEADDEQTAALQGLRAVLGPRHPQTLAAEYEVALCRWHTGHVDEAAARLDRVRRAVLRLPEGNPLALHVLSACSWVAPHARAGGGGDPADISGRRALDGYRAMLPEGHPYLFGIEANAALAAAGTDLERARPVLEASWRGFSARLGQAHPWTLGLAVALSASRHADGDTDGAAELSGAARERADAVLRSRHPLTLLLTVAHAADLRALGRTGRADAFDGPALRELRRSYADHPGTVAVTEGRRPVWEFEPVPLHGLP